MDEKMLGQHRTKPAWWLCTASADGFHMYTLLS